MRSCIFCSIVRGVEKCYKIWESSSHLAFLSIFPNTKGTTIVIPKKHFPSYAFDLDNKDLSDLIISAKRVAKILDKKLPNVGRTAMVLEGFGVDHVHAKLYPLHGTGNLKEWKPILSHQSKTFKVYEGYISTHEGERANDRELEELAFYLRKV